MLIQELYASPITCELNVGNEASHLLAMSEQLMNPKDAPQKKSGRE